MKPDSVHHAVFDSPIGWLGVRLDQAAVCRLDFLDSGEAQAIGDSTRARHARDAVLGFLEQPCADHGVEVRPSGTLFQARVWRQLQAIPCGQVLTYGELASRLDSGARAVANACRRNPVPLLIPCHRVVARDHIGGFAGQSEGRLARIKAWLLEREGVEIGKAAPISPAQDISNKTHYPEVIKTS